MEIGWWIVIFIIWTVCGIWTYNRVVNGFKQRTCINNERRAFAVMMALMGPLPPFAHLFTNIFTWPILKFLWNVSEIKEYLPKTHMDLDVAPDRARELTAYINALNKATDTAGRAYAEYVNGDLEASDLRPLMIKLADRLEADKEIFPEIEKDIQDIIIETNNILDKIK
jgi:hypothetical protein